eukprot:74402-Rhodomonas_salina.1
MSVPILSCLKLLLLPHTPCSPLPLSSSSSRLPLSSSRLPFSSFRSPHFHTRGRGGEGEGEGEGERGETPPPIPPELAGASIKPRSISLGKARYTGIPNGPVPNGPASDRLFASGGREKGLEGLGVAGGE